MEILAIIGLIAIFIFARKLLMRFSQWSERMSRKCVQASEILEQAHKDVVQEQKERQSIRESISKINTKLDGVRDENSDSYTKAVRKEIDELTRPKGG